MFAPKIFRVLVLVGLLGAVMLFAISCGGSKANVKNDAATPAAPVAVEVTTAPAILREPALLRSYGQPRRRSADRCRAFSRWEGHSYWRGFGKLR